MQQSIAVLIPCYNEALSIAKVIQEFRKQLPLATIYVYDNNSSDQTAAIAREHGAIVRHETRKGKGNVVRSMFRDIDADIYILVDGDNTYPAASIHTLIATLNTQHAAMVVGDRHSNGSYKEENSRALHGFGNALVSKLINTLYHENLQDIMSGYRVFSREFVKHFPINSSGFEIETEMTMHALDKCFRIVEVPIVYKDREEGSFSKLDTYSDGFKVLKTIFWLFKDYKPLNFFALFGFVFFLLALVVGMPVVIEYFQTHYVTLIPSAILAVGLMLIAMIAFALGLILDTIAKQHRENLELRRLQFKK